MAMRLRRSEGIGLLIPLAQLTNQRPVSGTKQKKVRLPPVLAAIPLPGAVPHAFNPRHHSVSLPARRVHSRMSADYVISTVVTWWLSPPR